MGTTRFRALIVAAAAVVALAAPATPAGAGPAGSPHLPDLRTLPPSDLHIQTGTREDGSPFKELRLSNTIWNAGQGPLELHAVNTGDTTFAYQRVFTHDAAGNESVVSDELVGTFIFHPTHNHWHFEGFALYELRKVNSDGTPGPVVRRGQKVSFCQIPTTLVSRKFKHFGWGLDHGYSCGENAMQGLPVGYGDTYWYGLDGQSIDITKVKNGIYWLTSTADFENRLAETDNTNNTAAVKIQIQGNDVTVIH